MKRKFIPRVVSSMLVLSMCAGQLSLQSFAAGSAREIAATNVLLNRPAVVSGTGVNTRPDMTLEKVNDGNKSTRVSLVDQSEEDIKFDFTLEGAKRIDRVEIYERCDRNYGDAPRIDDVTVQVQDGTEWVTVKNAVKTSKNEGNEVEHITVTFDPIVAKSKIRVITTDHEKANPTIWEMEAYGVDADTPESRKVTYNLKNVSTNGSKDAELGKDLSFTLTADYGYTLPESITVEMGGETLTDGYTYDKATGKVTVSAVSADVTVTAEGVEGQTSAVGLVRLNEGEEKDITTRFSNTEDAVTWTSNNEEVAVVDANGKVTAKADGTAVIKAVCGDETEYCTVVVEGYMRTWYKQPAKSWERDCLPIGNGNLGGMIYGNTEKERIQVNEITLWSKGNGFQGGNKEGAWKNLKPIQDQMFSRLDNNFSGINVGGILGNESGCGAYQSLGDIYLDFEGAARTDSPKNYMRELDLDDGLVRVSYENAGVQFTREYMADYPDNVMAFRLTSSKEDALEFKLDYNQGSGRTAIVDKAEENSIIYQGKVNAGGMAFATQMKVVAPDADVTCNDDGTISVANGEDVLVLMSAGTNYDIEENKNIKNISDFYTADGDYLDNNDPNGDVAASKVADRVNAAEEKGYADLVKTHMDDYQEIMGRVNLDLGDEEKAAMPTDELLDTYKEERSNYAETVLFQFGRYLLLSSSRDSLPANLQGIWNSSNNPGWNSDYHFNVNLQMNYWPAFVTDMEETAMPLVDYMDSLRVPGNVTAREHFGVENGWVVNTEANPFGKTSPGSDFSWGFTPGSGAWTCQNLWDYYEFTKDPEVLKKIYPILKEGAEFWLGYMVEDPRTRVDGVEGSGELVAAPGGSSEHGPIGIGTTYDMSLSYMEMKNTVEAAKILGVDEGLQKQIEAALPRMKPFWIGTDGQLKEWREETGYSSMPGTDPLHRHLSHLLALHPGNLITKEGGDFTEYYDAAVRALRLRDDGSSSVGWSMAQKGNIFARVRDGEKALHHMNLLLTRGLGDNLLDVYVHPGWGDIFQIEANMGYTAGVAEMLLQSHQGFMEPLPALPEAWADGSYTGLVARGDFKTDAEWSDGNLDKFVVRSEKGGECIVRYPNISKATLAGGTFTVIDMNTVQIDTTAGGEYVFTNFTADREALEALVKEAKESYAEEDYAAKDWDAFQKVLVKAEVVLNKDAATAEEIENAFNQLRKAMTVLENSDASDSSDSSDSSRDLPVKGMKATAGSAEADHGSEGPVEYALDNNEGTFWHSDWAGTTLPNLWIDIALPEATTVGGVRVLSRPGGGNGTINAAEIWVKTADSDEYVKVLDNAALGSGWNAATFDEIKNVTNVKIQPLETAGGNKYASAAEIRIMGPEKPTDSESNKADLQAVVDEAKALNKADYTAESWAVLETKLAAAEAVLANEEATDYDVLLATANLENAIRTLVEATEEEESEKVWLAELINYAESQKANEDYKYVVPVVKTAFEKALAEAIAVNENANATQAEVDAAYDALLHMVHYLTFTGNSESLKVLADAAHGLNEKLYTADSWAVLVDALAKAEAVLADENALQAEIDVARDVLQKAMDALVENPVDKTKLQKLVDKSKKYEDAIKDYTPETAEIFEGAFAHAKEVLANEDATQEEIDAAYAGLQNAIFGLRLIPDKGKLEDLIKNAEKVDLADYTVQSAAAFTAALDNAKAVFADANATAEDVKAAEKALKKAQKDLVAKADVDKKDADKKGSDKVASADGNNKAADKAAKTGDASQMTVLMTMLMAAAAAVISFRRKERR